GLTNDGAGGGPAGTGCPVRESSRDACDPTSGWAHPPSPRHLRRRRRCYCTLALTAVLPATVNVHVFALVPPLEQAPDQIALRPLETVSVIGVPVTNVAEPVLPTASLIPAGLEVTRSPLLPVAVTVTVADGDAGVTDSVVVLVAPPKAPLIV